MAKKFYEFQPNDEVAESGDLSNLTPASVDLVSWQDLTIQDGEESIEDKIGNDAAHLKTDGVASAFAEKAYAAGDFCTYDGKAYVCKLGYTSTAASPDPGNDATHWQLANLPTLFSSDNTSLTSTAQAVSDNTADTSTTPAAGAASVTLVNHKTTPISWANNTSTKATLTVNFTAAGTSGQLRYMELLITDVTANMIDLATQTGYTFKAADSTALKPEAGDNLIVFAEYATNAFIVSRQVLSTVTAA